MPALVTPEGFQTHQGFIAHTTPELTRAFESALILSAGRFHGAAALGFSGAPCGSVVHSLPVALQILQFGFNRLTLVSAEPFGQSLQVIEQRGRPPLFE